MSTNGDNSLRIWSLTREEEKYHVSHTDEITCFAITADSLHVITGSRDMSLKVWQATGGKLAQVSTETTIAEWKTLWMLFYRCWSVTPMLFWQSPFQSPIKVKWYQDQKIVIWLFGIYIQAKRYTRWQVTWDLSLASKFQQTVNNIITHFLIKGFSFIIWCDGKSIFFVW